jgi:type I restriction enzyme S subunit
MFKRCPVANGDILYTKVGATYGRPALVDTDKEFSLYVSVALLKPRHDVVNNVFLCHQMATDFVKHQADKSIKGIGVPDLHLNMIRNFHILVPPKSLQLEFNSRIAYVEKQKETIRASIADTQKLLDYTMDKYFG